MPASKKGREATVGRVAVCVAVVFAHAEASASECSPPTPACHLKQGQQLLDSDPKRAAEALMASYKLDERTDTLALYATAVQADRKYAHALETWQRVIVFRESELDAAKATARASTGRKAAAARAAAERARAQMEQAAEAIIKLWPNVGHVNIKLPAGVQLTVTRDGVEVDPSRDVLVNAGRDELVFTRKGGPPQRVTVEVAPGAFVNVDAPRETAAVEPVKPTRAVEPRPARPAKPVEPPKPEAEEGEEEEEAPAEPPLTGETALTTRTVEQPRSRTMARVGIGLTAGAVVAGGIAGALGYLASRDYDRARDAGCSADNECPIGPAADLAERSNDRARLAQISAISGGALLATGVVMWVVGRGKTRRAATDVSLRVFSAPAGGPSAALGWRF